MIHSWGIPFSQRSILTRALNRIPDLTVFDGRANYLLVRIDRTDTNAIELSQTLLNEHKLAIRVCDNYYGLGDDYFRVAVRTKAEKRENLEEK